MTTMSARDFDRDVSAATRAAERGPITITDGGRAAYVLLSASHDEFLTDKRSIVDWLQTDSNVEFEPPRLTSLPQAADL